MKLPFARKSRIRVRHPVARIGIALGVAAGVAVLFSRADLAPDYSHLEASLLAGAEDGHYFSIATRLVARAAAQKGKLRPVATAGSAENVTRLTSGTCDAQFALVQEGTPLPAQAGLDLVARLPRTEAVLLLSRDPDRYRTLADLRGHSVGIGAEGSGTAQLARRILTLPELSGLGLDIQNHSAREQIDRLATGRLDVGVFVIDDGAALAREAILTRGLGLVTVPQLAALAARFPELSVGEIPAGRFDPVRGLPGADTRVLRVETLLLANHCARHATRVAMLMVLAAEFPDLIARNQSRPAPAGVPLDVVSRQFFASGEPEMADRYAPWLGNLMPPSNWVYVVMTVSLLFNAMNLANRFRLWRLDHRRARLDDRTWALFGPRMTYERLRENPPRGILEHPEKRAEAEALLTEFSELRQVCRAQAASLLVPMGQEMSYRYQEDLIEDAIAAFGTLLEPTADRS